MAPNEGQFFFTKRLINEMEATLSHGVLGRFFYFLNVNAVPLKIHTVAIKNYNKSAREKNNN